MAEMILGILILFKSARYFTNCMQVTETAWVLYMKEVYLNGNISHRSTDGLKKLTVTELNCKKKDVGILLLPTRCLRQTDWQCFSHTCFLVSLIYFPPAHTYIFSLFLSSFSLYLVKSEIIYWLLPFCVQLWG